MSRKCSDTVRDHSRTNGYNLLDKSSKRTLVNGYTRAAKALIYTYMYRRYQRHPRDRFRREATRKKKAYEFFSYITYK